MFNSITTIGPMLGLLGTVGGMIRAFNNIATSDAMGRPELLAKGISEALLATATGLMVAVPAIVLYWWFVSVVDRLTVRIDALGPRRRRPHLGRSDPRSRQRQTDPHAAQDRRLSK